MPFRTISTVAFLLIATAPTTPLLAGTTALTVANPGFESPSYPQCGFSAAQNWSATSSGGAWHPGSQQQCGFYFGGPPAEGSQIGFINGPGAFLHQTLASTLAPSTKYQLLVEVGRRADGYDFDGYRIELRAGGIVLAEDPGVLDPAPGTWATSSICAEIGVSHAALGLPLEIRLYSTAGIQANFDDVRLFASAPDGRCETLSGLPADLDGDGDVDGGDLGLLLGAWGACPACDLCTADLNGDCVVDGADLGILLGSWG
jgi:hypothetical protein